MTEEETVFTAVKAAAAICGAAAVIGLTLTYCTPARAQGIYMLNGRATPSVIVGPGGAYPVIPNPCYGGPCPLMLAPPVRGPVYGPGPLVYGPPGPIGYVVPPPYVVYVDPLPAFIGGIIGGALSRGGRRW